MMLTNLYVSNISMVNNRKKIDKKRLKVVAGDNTMIELTGKFLGTFILFTSTLNWLHYRNIRKRYEENKKDDK